MKLAPVLVIALAATAAFAGPGAAMTLDDAIRAARQTNPTIAAARADEDLASAALAEARAGRLPTVTLQGSLGRGTNDLGGFFGFAKRDVDPRAATLEVREHLFAGGAISAAVEGAGAGKSASAHRTKSTELTIKLRVGETFMAVLRAQAMAEAAMKYLEVVGLIADQAALRFKAGEIPRSDLAQAEARRAEGVAALASAKGDLLAARAAFRHLVGVDPDGLEAPLSSVGPSPDAEAVTAAAERDNPDLLAARDVLAAARAKVRGASADLWPKVDVALTRSSMRDEFFPGYRSDQSIVGIEGRWTLFSGGSTRARIAEARAGERRAAAELAEAERAVRSEAVSATANLAAAVMAGRASSEQLAAARIALDSLTQEARVGQRPTVDVLNGAREVLVATAADVAASTNVALARLRVFAVMGQ